MRSSSGRSTRHGRRQRGVNRSAVAGRPGSPRLADRGRARSDGDRPVAAGCGGIRRQRRGVRPRRRSAVFPIPGARVASPQTQIAFRGLPIGQVGKVVVTGLPERRPHRPVRIGLRPGRRELPAGEAVRARRGGHGPGPACNILGAATPGTFHFTVATPSGSIPATPLPPAGRAPGDVLTFHSRPDLTPASVEITKEDPDPGPGRRRHLPHPAAGADPERRDDPQQGWRPAVVPAGAAGTTWRRTSRFRATTASTC